MVTGAAVTVKVMAPHRQRPVPNGLSDISHPLAIGGGRLWRWKAVLKRSGK
jgi:hypothetical protein